MWDQIYLEVEAKGSKCCVLKILFFLWVSMCCACDSHVMNMFYACDSHVMNMLSACESEKVVFAMFNIYRYCILTLKGRVDSVGNWDIDKRQQENI